MASNITKNFKAKAGLRMSAGGILSTKQDDSTLFSAPGSDASSKMALSLASQAQPQDAVAANSSLSNTDRFKMANPTGDAYGIDGKMKGVVSVTPGSSAENSMLNEQGSLRQNMTDASNMSRLRRVDSMTGGNGLDMYRNSLSSGRGASARFGLGLRAGGVVDPVQAEVYEIDGPGDGSGVDDKTKVNVHGKKINVSKGERFAVFPAKVPAENIEEFIESQTGEPSATSGSRGLRDGMRAVDGLTTPTPVEYKNPLSGFDKVPTSATPITDAARSAGRAAKAVEPYAQKALSAANKVATPVSVVQGSMNTLGNDVALQLPGHDKLTGWPRFKAAAKLLPAVVGDVASSTLDALAGDPVAWGHNLLNDMGVTDERMRYGQINENYREGMKPRLEKEGVIVPTTRVMDDPNRITVPTPLELLKSDKDKPVAQHYGNEGRRATNADISVPSGTGVAPASEAELNRNEELRDQALKAYDPQERAVQASWDLRDALQNARGRAASMDAAGGSLRAMSANEGLRRQFNENQEMTALVPGNSGAIKATVDKNGRMVFSGENVKGAAGLSGYDMKTDIESLRKANAIRQSMIDGQRTDIDQGVYKSTGDAGMAEAVKKGGMTAAQAIGAHQQGLQTQAINDLRKGQQEFQQEQSREAAQYRRDALNETIRHRAAVEAANTQKAKEAATQQRISDLDALIDEQGFDEKESKAFRDFMRQNFFGRKHKIDGKEVDVPGMEDMTQDQMRALMPNAAMRYRFNRDLNAASRSGTSMNEAKSLRARQINSSDIARGPSGMPDFFSTDQAGKVPVFGEGSWFEAVTPDILRSVNKKVIEEIGPDGKPVRVALARDLEKDKVQSLDRAAHLASLGVK